MKDSVIKCFVNYLPKLKNSKYLKAPETVNTLIE